jgi:Flp pilus assembly protein TadB
MMESNLIHLSTDVAALKQWRDSHEDRCKERYSAILDSTKEIKAGIQEINANLKKTTVRLEEKLEAAAKDRARIDGRIDAQRVTILSTMLGAAVALLAWMSKWIWAAVVGILK